MSRRFSLPCFQTLSFSGDFRFHFYYHLCQQMLERYDAPRDYLQQHDYFESYTVKEREQMLAVEDWPKSLLSGSVMDSTSYYLKYLAQWTAISVILLLSPTLVRDRLRRTRPLQ